MSRRALIEGAMPIPIFRRILTPGYCYPLNMVFVECHQVTPTKKENYPNLKERKTQKLLFLFKFRFLRGEIFFCAPKM